MSLLPSKRDVGYGSRRKRKKSMNDIFEASVQHANSQGIERSGVSWERRFGRLKS